MSGGNGTKYVTLVGDKNVHLYAESENTVCGIPIPIASGAEWTYAEPEKVCAACTKIKDKADDVLEAVAEPEPEPEPEPAPKAKAKK
jgi:hypothetical protein